MKSYSLAAVLAASVLSGGAYAADLTKPAPPPPAPASTSGWDYAFGGKLQTDYISRGITQTNHQPGATAYGELRYNVGDTQFYSGTQIWSVKLPTNTAAEVDLYGGIRQTWGNFSVDVGGIEYWYPNNTNQYWTNGTSTFLNPNLVIGSPNYLALASRCPVGTFCATTAVDPSYFEFYVKPSYNVTDSFTIGGNMYYSPNWDNYGFPEVYASGTAKYAFGTSGFSVSGELGHEWLGSTKASSIFGALKYIDYTTWNAGVSYAWKVFTFDVRYYGTTLNSAQCYIDTSDPRGNVPGLTATNSSGWCGNRVMASLSFDLTSKDLK